MRLILNPDLDGDSTISSFPISLRYQWELLAYLRFFKTQGFSFTPDGFFKLGIELAAEEYVYFCKGNIFVRYFVLVLHKYNKKKSKMRRSKVFSIFFNYYFYKRYFTTVASNSTFNVSNNMLTSIAVSACLILCLAIHS